MEIGRDRATRAVNVRDLCTGLLLLTVAALFAITALRRLALGTASAMGPGYFPVMISGLLALVAVLILVRSVRTTGSLDLPRASRALVCTLGAPLLFAFAIAPLGFVPAIAGATMLAAWGSRLMTIRFALALTSALTVLCTVLFVKMLRMPVALFGPWLGG